MARFFSSSQSQPQATTRPPASIACVRVKLARDEMVVFTTDHYLVIRKVSAEQVGVILTLLGLADAVAGVQPTVTEREFAGQVTATAEWKLPAPVTASTAAPELANWPCEFRRNQAAARASVTAAVPPALAEQLSKLFGKKPAAAPTPADDAEI